MLFWIATQRNWAPRGAETAQLLYNISRGWVTHNEVCDVFIFISLDVYFVVSTDERQSVVHISARVSVLGISLTIHMP